MCFILSLSPSESYSVSNLIKQIYGNLWRSMLVLYKDGLSSLLLPFCSTDGWAIHPLGLCMFSKFPDTLNIFVYGDFLISMTILAF
jgi:hypothetical protein